MVLITDEIKKVLENQKLCFVATVSKDGTPNLSPKGTLYAWNDAQLIFADIRSPQTIANLKNNSSLEINVVDPINRKGFRFKGSGKVISEGNELEKMLEFYKNKGVKSKINQVVLVDVESILEITSPLYDLGLSEDEIKAKWKNHYLSL